MSTLIVTPRPRGRPRVYHTEEQRRQAELAYKKRWYYANHETVLAKRKDRYQQLRRSEQSLLSSSANLGAGVLSQPRQTLAQLAAEFNDYTSPNIDSFLQSLCEAYIARAPQVDKICSMNQKLENFRFKFHQIRQDLSNMIGIDPNEFSSLDDLIAQLDRLHAHAMDIGLQAVSGDSTLRDMYKERKLGFQRQPASSLSTTHKAAI